MINKDLFIEGLFEKYDERLLENRLTIEGNTVAILLQDLTTYDDCKFTFNNFITKDGRFLYNVGKTLRDAGYNYIDEVTVFSQCSQEVKDHIIAMGGYKTIQHLLDVVNIKNLDGIFDDFIKSNIILKLYIDGFNLFTEVELHNGKKTTPIKLFEGFRSTDVIDWYDAKISGFGSVSNNKITGEEIIKFDDSFFNNLSKGYTMGTSYGDCGTDINGDKISTFPFLSNTTMGYGVGLHAIVGFSGVGKTVMLVQMIMSLISKGRRCIFVENEMTIEDIKVVILTFLLYRYFGYSKLTKRKLISGVFTDEDKIMLKKASELWNEKYSKSIKIVSLSDADANLTCQIIKNAILREGYDLYCVDTFKLDTSNDRKTEGFWMNLIDDSKRLHSISLKYNVCGIISIQLALSNTNRLWLDKSCLSTAKGVSEILDSCIGIRAVTTEELIPGSPTFCSPFRSKKDDQDNWVEEPYQDADIGKVWRMLFIIKNRKGVCSDDNGVTWLVRYDGDHCSMYETAKARSSRKIINTN